MIKTNISSFANDANKSVIIFDTCGERFNLRNVFGVDLRSWKVVECYANIHGEPKKMSNDDFNNYLAWTLTNVLNRNEIASDKTLYYLNPVQAGLKVCVDVHQKKVEGVFNKKIKLFSSDPTSVDDAKEKLKDGYEKYAMLLKGFDIDKYASDIVGKIKFA